MTEHQCACAAGPWQTGEPPEDRPVLAQWGTATPCVAQKDRRVWVCGDATNSRVSTVRGRVPDRWAEIRDAKGEAT